MKITVTSNRSIVLGWLGSKLSLFHNGKDYECPKPDDSLLIDATLDQPLRCRIGLIVTQVTVTENTNAYKVVVSKALSLLNIVIFGLLMLFMIVINAIELEIGTLIAVAVVYILILVLYTRWLKNSSHLKIVPVQKQ